MNFPKAEAIARKMPLPLQTCAVTKELYGYAKPILNKFAAHGVFDQAQVYGEAREVAFAILAERVASLPNH